MSAVVAYGTAVAVCVFAGWLVPAAVMRGLALSLRGTRLSATNYRGRDVYLGLGLVWIVWAVSLMVASTAFDMVGSLLALDPAGYAVALFEGPLTLPLYGVPLMLVAVSVILGFVDDAFGSAGDKGFRGHLSALASGRLTTGGLKLLGIGAVAAVYAWHIADGRSDPSSGTLETLGVWVLATLTIALSANLLNLMDLRPGRALKTYTMLAVIAAPLFVIDASRAFAAYAASLAEMAVVPWGDADTTVAALCMLVVLLGPVAAVWRFDLGEQGMLGDAGSNAMGAIVGYLLAASLPTAWLAGVAVALLALNLLSERVSFSAAIERIAPLRALDMLGRLPDDPQTGDAGREIGDDTG
ncbi:MAG: hypothetical protein JW733_06650 [Coriobacteriia bacterium]|nr:hypothetical protein [Coriobacteriia bacterium]MBN2839989.1 hypothetical protein [Coriobacteriia bacterium]